MVDRSATPKGEIPAAVQMQPLVRAENLSKTFRPPSAWGKSRRDMICAVDGVSLSIYPAETLALVGESGCGKTTFAKLLLQLQSPTAGDVFFEDVCLSRLPQRKLRSWRTKMQLVFQNPANALNPRRTVYQLLGEAMRLGASGQRGTEDEVLKLLDQVGLPSVALHRYPHHFSGGQKQRIAIARALAVQPHFVVCDEAVSALDTSVQMQILRLLRDLQLRHGIAYLFITHNLSVAHHIADRIAVMYRGRVVEIAPAPALWRAPLHPYTRSLLACSPRLQTAEKTRPPVPVPKPAGQNASAHFDGCAYAAACPQATEVCRQQQPRLRPMHGREIACHAALD